MKVNVMPILAEEPNLYPEHLLGTTSLLEDHRWHVVYTRARHEKSLARHLYDNGMSFYLPLIAKDQFIRGRKRTSWLPVFSSYMFYFGNAPGDVARLAPYCVSAVIPVEDQYELQGELAAIHHLLENEIPLTLEARLAPGRKVRVKSGALRGLEGTILRRKGAHRLLVSVNYLQKGVSIEIDDFMIESL